MAKARTHVEGLDYVLGSLARMGNRGQEAVSMTVDRLAERTAELAKDSMGYGFGPSAPGSAPHRQTGELADSVEVEKISGQRAQARVGTSEIKGYFLELGRNNMEPRPWLFPAFEAASAEAEDVLRNSFEATE